VPRFISSGAPKFKDLALLNLLVLWPLCQICALNHPWPRQALGIIGQMLRRKVRIAPHHLRRLPAAQFLQYTERSSALDVPTGLGMLHVRCFYEYYGYPFLHSNDFGSSRHVAPYSVGPHSANILGVGLPDCRLWHVAFRNAQLGSSCVYHCRCSVLRICNLQAFQKGK